LSGGLYVGKSIFQTLTPASLDRYQQLRECGFKVVYLHEEGGIFRGSSDDWRRILDMQFDMNCFDANDVVCTWGEFQAKHCIEKNPAMKDRVFATGHPRFDLYKAPFDRLYRSEVDALRARYGRFILINSNFSNANSGLGIHHLDTQIKEGSELPAKIKAMRAWAHDNQVLASFAELVYRLSERYPAHCIVYRPHPSERHATYGHLFRGLSNVHVVHAGAVGPWLLAAEAIIHDGCTTAVEAYFAGRRPIQYRPNSPAEFEFVVPTAVSQCCTSVEEVFEQIDCMPNDGNSRMRELPPTATQLLTNFASSSMRELTEVMETAAAELERTSAASEKSLPAAIRMITTTTALRSGLAAIRPSKRRQHTYSTTKFPGFSESLLAARIQSLRSLTNKNIVIRFYSPTLFELTSDEA
jgi:surface carbohydrate biosynthesis protein